MMKKYISLVLILFISFIISGCNSEKNNIIRKVNVRLGIDLVDENIEIFKDKRVGLITNPTGVNSYYKSTIDVLYENENINLTCLFAPRCV